MQLNLTNKVVVTATGHRFILFSSRAGRWLGLVAVILVVAGCSGRTIKPGGGFYGGDLPPESVPENIDAIPDAVPHPLVRSKTGNKPYQALGKTWHPMKTAAGYRARGVASWYGRKFHGRRTSSGEPYDMFAMTAAHPVLPLPSFVRVTNLDNNRQVVVKVNDRGPFLHGRIIDLSYAAAAKLGITETGTGRVEVVALEPVESGTTTASEQQPALARNSVSSILYTVQLGVFNELINAIALRNRLRAANFTLTPSEDTDLQSRGKPFRVLTGPYATEQEADQERGRLHQLTGIVGQIRKM